jgi:LysR family transcriptional regulator, transcriptional activator of nhaA
MEWLNYHHLLYFWTVARAGSITKACEQLRLSQPTVSGQLRMLEQFFGEKLFVKSGRNLRLTEFGTVVYRYADEIFSVGRELLHTVRGRAMGGRPLRLFVGITDALPKLVAYRLIEPALRMPETVQVVCREDKTHRLVADLAVNALDIVLTDSPLNPEIRVRAFSHLLGECGVTFFGTPETASKHRRRFPRSLDEAKVILPTNNTTMRRSLDQWFDAQKIRPRIAGEFEDSALLMTFGQAGVGIFPVPSAVEAEVQKQYGVKIVGRIDGVRERFYAISVERRIKHPAVVAISAAARQELFN